MQIPNEEARLDDGKSRQEITSFQPERRDSYTLRPSASRRDPFVDVRREVIVEDPEAVRKRYEAEENVTIDLEKQEIRGPDGGMIKFEIDGFRKHCLLNGLDDIGITLQKERSIASFEEKAHNARPWA